MAAGELPTWIGETRHGAALQLRVTPRASQNAIGEERAGRLTVRVTAAPEDGKANAAVCKLFAKRLRVGKTSLAITVGQTSRAKTLEIAGVSAQEVADALAP